jgi:hypothetical protein
MGCASTSGARILWATGRDPRERMTLNENANSNRSRLRWIVLAPGMVGVAMCTFAFFTMNSRQDTLAELGFGMFYGSVLVPFIVALYLMELGRRYVAAVHFGLQSRVPFVLMYGAANLIL